MYSVDTFLLPGIAFYFTLYVVAKQNYLHKPTITCVSVRKHQN